jgi:glycosyltransferase involved in cell wall biosynthesis
VDERRKRQLSVIICSRNRVEMLKNCLRAISIEEMEKAGGELILVNNGSTDQTEQVMRHFRESSPFPVEVINEPTPGLGRARTSGLARAAGETIVFTDDDCYLAGGYLLRVSAVFASGTFDYCGGRILLYDETDSQYGCNRREELRIIPPFSFIRAGEIQGANMVVHRRVVDKIGGFDSMLGAGTPFRCEDIEFCARASMAGFAGAHVPDLIVYHHHGRKPGPDIQKLAETNDYSRGAYYMMFLLRGNLTYLRNWIRISFNLGAREMAGREIRGAVAYLLTRARNALGIG